MLHTTQTHPLTGRPIEPLGYRKDGRLIWPIMGGAPDDAGADAGGAAGGADGAQDAGDKGGGSDAGDKGGADPWADPAKAKAEIERLRRENASDRTAAKQQAADEARSSLTQQIGKALGIVKGDEVPTVEELTKQLGEQKAATDNVSTAHRESQAELVVWRHAEALKVDAQAVTDSRAFAAAIKNLDPASDSFVEDVKKAAQAAADQNPKLKAVPVAGKGGADHTGGSGEQNGKPVSLASAVTKHYDS